jgi:starvation-inducible DNA-binding protein
MSKSIPSDLKQTSREKIVEALNPLVADAFALYVKTKSFHWHVTGPHFRDYHLLFDEQAEQIFNTIDTLAERCRKLSGSTITSIGHIHKLSSVKDESRTTISAADMIKKLIKDNQECIERMRKAHDLCAESGDCATASILEIFIDEAERRVWFLGSI